MDVRAKLHELPKRHAAYIVSGIGIRGIAQETLRNRVSFAHRHPGSPRKIGGEHKLFNQCHRNSTLNPLAPAW
jgi:hypothetical protein